MARVRRWTDEQFIEAVKAARSIAQVLASLGLNPTGANYKTVHLTVERLGLNTSHFQGKSWSRGSTHNHNSRLPLSEVLVKGSTYRGRLKERLIKQGLLPPACAVCEINEWLGQPLVLHLDHVNGDNRDNRLTNLRLLCPNCHSQTDTYCRRKS